MRTEISNLADLRDLLGEPLPRTLAKDRATLAPEQIDWIRESPFCLVGTSGSDGTCDVSPKGDPAPMVHVLDTSTIAIPERIGNKRADGYRNILENPHVGLLFMVPGRGDTLRINGTATLLSDAPYFDELVVKGHRPQMVIEVAIEQIFFHCAKAFIRSTLWDPTTWHPERVLSRAKLAKALERPDDTLEELEAYYGQSYSKGLY